MKSTTLFIFLFLVSCSFAQEKSQPLKGHFGVAINSSMVYQLKNLAFAPTGFYYQNGHQFELGVGIYPFDRMFNSKIGVEFNYKYFINGIDERFSSYVLARTGLLHIYPNGKYYEDFGNSSIRENHLFLMIGYGFQIKLFQNAYIGTNFAIGGGAYNRKYTNQSDLYHGNVKMLEEFYRDGALQLNIGCRF